MQIPQSALNGIGGLAHHPAVELVGLTRRFGAFTAVDELSFTVTSSEIFGLIGANGAGKSTVIKMLTTLLPPSAGAAVVAGFDITGQATDVRRHIGYVPQLLSADGALTAWENLLLSARLYNVPHSEVRTRIEHALGAVGLTPFAHHLVQGFSGGMIRRLEIAQSMLHHPRVLFMDEPTVGLDPVARRTVLEHVRAVRKRFGTTVLITSHYMEEVEELCERIAVLSHGRLVAIGTPDELKARVGPHATLDDVFAALAGPAVSTEEQAVRLRACRQCRRSAGGNDAPRGLGRAEFTLDGRSDCIFAESAQGSLAFRPCLTGNADLAKTAAVHLYRFKTPTGEYDAIPNARHSSQQRQQQPSERVVTAFGR